MTIKLIVGLQNPGTAYENTRHNVGGWLVETLVNSCNARFHPEKKMHAVLADFKIDNHALKAILPATFMNHSGLAVRETSQFYRIVPDEILVVHDDLDLPAGRIKLKTGGGHGGHNGLRDISTQLGSALFHRLRIGIGHPGQKDMVLNYVLGKPHQDDKKAILEAIDRGIAVIPALLTESIAHAMNLLNA
jgi:PTH1 family peptidyl-tRNA hydrolase